MILDWKLYVAPILFSQGLISFYKNHILLLIGCNWALECAKEFFELISVSFLPCTQHNDRKKKRLKRKIARHVEVPCLYSNTSCDHHFLTPLLQRRYAWQDRNIYKFISMEKVLYVTLLSPNRTYVEIPINKIKLF